MLGRAAYHTPEILTGVDYLLEGNPAEAFDFSALIESMAEYAARHISCGGRLGHITRHMVGLFHGQPGARRWRQTLSTEAVIPGAGAQVLRDAFAAVDISAKEAA
jgi:tRNA-dihydrouridine synthase A